MASDPQYVALTARAALALTLTLTSCFVDGNSAPSHRCGPDQGRYEGTVPSTARRSNAQADVVLALAGDAMLGRGISAALSRDGAFAIWRGFSDVLADVDVFAMNLETTITHHTDPWPNKKYSFRMEPNHVEATLLSLPLPSQAARFASMANNHSLDYLVPGLLETLDHVDGAGFARAGAGTDLRSAQSPAVVTTSAGKRVAFLAAADHCGCDDVCAWMAGVDTAGIWYVDVEGGDWGSALAAISDVKGSVDAVVFSLHVGPNWVAGSPGHAIQKFARALVAAGVDAVFAHSSHHVLPFDVVDGKHIFYGLGDLIDDYVVDPDYHSNLGFIAKLRLTPSGEQHLEIVPTRIDHETGHFVSPLDTADADYAAVLSMARKID